MNCMNRTIIDNFIFHGFQVQLISDKLSDGSPVYGVRILNFHEDDLILSYTDEQSATNAFAGFVRGITSSLDYPPTSTDSVDSSKMEYWNKEFSTFKDGK